MTWLDTPFDKRQSKVTVQIKKNFSNSNNLTPKSNPKSKHKKDPSEYTCEIIVDKPTTFFDDLQNPTENKTHDKVAQSIDSFTDERSFASQTRTTVNLTLALQQEVDLGNLPPIPLIRFDGNPSKWPEFIENFFTRLHLKQTFDDNTRMIRLLRTLDGEAKRNVGAIGCNKIFYATALKSLKRGFGHPLIVAHSRLSSVFDKPQVKANDKISIRQFHQQLKFNCSWLLSMGHKSPIFSSENLTKAIHCLLLHLRNRFYKFTNDSNLMDGSVNLLIF